LRYCPERIASCKVEVHDPLKQGLKRCVYGAGSQPKLVEVHDPLKQGLKHSDNFIVRLQDVAG